MADDKVIKQDQGENWTLFNGDCCDVMRGLPNDSVGFSVFSPPFASLYVYSDSECDMGNCDSEHEFFEHFDYMAKELHRVLMPGRLAALHTADLGRTKESFGYVGIYDFTGDIIRAMAKAGFVYHARITIWKDPLVEATRTKTIRLLHKQLMKDSATSAAGIPDSMLIFRKLGDNPEPIEHPEGLHEYAGADDPGAGMDGIKASHFRWRGYASPVWMDIRQTRTLNYKEGRDSKDEKHICPLQLDVISRCLHLWSNPGDVVLSPFAGIGSEGYESVRMGRKFVGVELKPSYFDLACKHLEVAEQEFNMADHSLFATAESE